MSEATIETVANDAMNTAPDKVKVKQSLVEFEGTQYFVNKESLNDLDVMEYLAEIQANPDNAAIMVLVVKKIMGNEQWNKFKDSQRGDEGRAAPEKLEELITKIFKAVGADSEK